MTDSIATSLPKYLQPDCNNCSGLCCVVLPFDASQGFGFDKAAHSPCRHLQADFRCEIHSQLEQRGFSGCVQYNCFGAGQATMELFDSTSWKHSQEHAEQMFDLFTQLRPIHQLMSMLTVALNHALEAPTRELLQQALKQLDQIRQSKALLFDREQVKQLKSTAQAALKLFAASPEASRLKAKTR